MNTTEQPNAGVGSGHGTGSMATRFQPGHGGRKHRRTGAGKDEAGQVPGLLKAMRYVTRRAEKSDRTQLQKECRQWLRDDRKGFLSKMADLEKAALMAAAKAPPEKGSGAPRGAPEPPVDEGSERVEEMIERLLRECQP